MNFSGKILSSLPIRIALTIYLSIVLFVLIDKMLTISSYYGLDIQPYLSLTGIFIVVASMSFWAFKNSFQSISDRFTQIIVRILAIVITIFIIMALGLLATTDV